MNVLDNNQRINYKNQIDILDNVSIYSAGLVIGIASIMFLFT